MTWLHVPRGSTSSWENFPAALRYLHMKRNFWICLLVFSLALNLGGLAALAYMRSHDRASPWQQTQPHPFREMWGPLNLEPEQKQALQSLLPEHRRRIQDLRVQLSKKRMELFDLVKEEPTVWPTIQAKVNEVSVFQRKLEEEMLRFCLAFGKHLRPEQRTSFIASVERRLPQTRGGQGRQPPRWKRDMGVGAPPPAGPCGP
jgi:Spy/CpxP family protein refolding chaperone